MKTLKDVALVTPCFLDGEDKLGNSRFARNQRYVHYYSQISNELGFTAIWLLDNASNLETLSTFTLTEPRPYIQRFHERLEGRGEHAYPYCWRALWFIRELIGIGGYKKIIFIDSDGFILTKRMANYVRNCNSGWVSFWSENPDGGGLPDSSVWVLNEDAFPAFLKYTNGRWEDKVGLWMEKDLPFTDIEMRFRSSRFGEQKQPPPQDKTMDFYAQARLTTELKFGEYGI